MGNNRAVAVVAAVVLVVAVVWIATSLFNCGGPPGPTAATFWYDTGSNELYAVSAREYPPVPASSGKEGVLAYVFKKDGGSCDNADDRFIAYLLRYPNRDEVINAQGAIKRGIAMGRAEVRRVDESEWVPIQSEDGQAIVEGYDPTSTDRCTAYRK